MLPAAALTKMPYSMALNVAMAMRSLLNCAPSVALMGGEGRGEEEPAATAMGRRGEEESHVDM